MTKELAIMINAEFTFTARQIVEQELRKVVKSGKISSFSIKQVTLASVKLDNDKVMMYQSNVETETFVAYVEVTK